MSNLFNNIEELCTINKINITEMCRRAKVSRASLTDLKKGRKQSLSAETLSKISALFNVSVDYLLGNSIEKDINIKLDDFTYTMYKLSKVLTEKDKEILISMAEQLKKANEITK